MAARSHRVAVMPPEQEIFVATLAKIERGDADSRREALEALATQGDGEDERAAFRSSGGPRLVLEKRRTCSPADAELYDKVLFKLSNEDDVRAAARGDEAEFDQGLEGKKRIVVAIFATLFAVILVGVLVFMFFSLFGDAHSTGGFLAFWWMFVALLAIFYLGSKAIRFVVSAIEVRWKRLLLTHDNDVATHLETGTIRLLSVAWLKQTSLEIIAREQDLPKEAFVPPERAKALYLQRSRLVGVLSYRCDHALLGSLTPTRFTTTRPVC